MSYAIAVVCRPEFAAGFHLAGIPTQEAATAQEAVQRVAALAARPGMGVLLVQQELFDLLPHRESSEPLPMIVPFPGPSWAEAREESEAYITEILRQAIGYRVKLR